MPDDSLHWLDVEEIGEALHEAHPDVDPVAVRFVDLKKMVQSLPAFAERPGHPVNERILEEIQRHWVEERQGRPREPE